MKRSLKFRIGAAAAVLAAMLACAACAQPAQIKLSSALGNTAEAMMDKEYFTVTFTGTYTDAVSEKDVKYSAVAKLRKTADGYDYQTEETTTEGGKTTKQSSISVGGKLYKSTADESGNFTDWVKVPSDAQGDSTDSVLSGLNGDTLKSVIGDVDTDKVITEKNGKFEISTTNDYGEQFNAFKEFVLGGDGVQSAEYVAGKLNPNYTREQLVADINKIFKDNVRLLAMINGINDFLMHIGSDKTVKDIVDGLCKKADITADDIYRVLKPQSDGMLPDGMELMPPSKNATPYEYLLSTGAGMLSVDTLFEKAGIEYTTEEIREWLLFLLDYDDIPFDKAYNTFISAFDQYIEIVLMTLGAKEDMINELRQNGPHLGTASLRKYTVGKTAVSRKTVISAKDFTVLSFDLDAAADIAYGNDKTSVVNTRLVLHASFDYKTKVSITAPAA